MATIDVVQNPETGLGETGGEQEPIEKAFGFVFVSEAEQRAHGERSVTQPAVAVIPICRSARDLGKRSSRRCDDRAGRRICEEFQRRRAAQDCVAVLAAIGTTLGPVVPPLDRTLDALSHFVPESR